MTAAQRVPLESEEQRRPGPSAPPPPAVRPRLSVVPPLEHTGLPYPGARVIPARPASRGPYNRERRTLGDAAPLACTVGKEALEVVLGGDGLERLTRWVSPDVRSSLARQHSLARRAGWSGVNARVLRVRVFRVSPTAAEASLVIDDGERSRAVAMRLEDVAGRWGVTVLEIG